MNVSSTRGRWIQIGLGALALVLSLPSFSEGQISEPSGSTVSNSQNITSSTDAILIYGPAATGATLGVVNNSGILNAGNNGIENYFGQSVQASSGT